MKPQTNILSRAVFSFLFFFCVLAAFPASTHAATGILKQINFQGKVVNTDGTNVATASYTFLFCLYTTASPATPCTSGANNDAVWRESKSITVTNGIFRTALGDTTTLPGSVDFNTDNIYLGVNFNADGQMSPLIRFTAVPYAMNALKVAGLTVTDTTGTFTLTNAKTLSVANTLSFAGTDGTTITFQGTDTYVGLQTTDVLTNKTIGSTGLTFSGAGTDITTAAGEDLTILGATTGDVVVSNDSNSNFRVVGTAASGVDIVDVTNSGFGTTTDGVDGLAIDFTSATDGATDTNAGLHVTITDSGDSGDTISGLQVTAGTASAGNQYGINIDTIATPGSGNEYALNIGTGWDRGLSIGDGTNYVALSSGAAPIYAGTARPSKTITLAPEYPGAVFTTFYGAGTDSSVTGTATSDPITTANGFKNYYSWTVTDPSLNYYTVAIRVTLPKDFDAWETSNAFVLNYATNNEVSTANNLLDVYLYKVDETTSAVASTTGLKSSAAATWTTTTIDDSVLDDNSAPEWDAADETVTIFLRMGAKSSNWVKLGDITLNYKAKF